MIGLLATFVVRGNGQDLQAHSFKPRSLCSLDGVASCVCSGNSAAVRIRAVACGPVFMLAIATGVDSLAGGIRCSLAAACGAMFLDCFSRLLYRSCGLWSSQVYSPVYTALQLQRVPEGLSTDTRTSDTTALCEPWPTVSFTTPPSWKSPWGHQSAILNRIHPPECLTDLTQ